MVSSYPPACASPSPSVDRDAARAGLALRDRLAKSEIAFAAVGPELDEQARLERRDEIVGEVQIVRPGADSINLRLKIARR